MNGISPLQYFSPISRVGKPVPSYHAGIGIDPDMPVTDSDIRLSGFIRPTAMEKFSGSTITAAPMWLATNPKDSNTYCYDASGKIYAIDGALNVTALNSGTALANGAGNGAEYYDNGILFATGTDITRYGNLDGTPSFNQTYWTGTLGKSPLSNTTYPSVNGVRIPNHPIFRHPSFGKNGVAYIGDVASNSTVNTNRGAIHQIWTDKTSAEGDTDVASTYNALQLDYGHYPTAIEAYQDTLAVAAIEGVSTTTKQKNAVLYFWDATSLTPNKLIQVEFPDPLITAMKNVNGTLTVWSGNANGGYRVSQFSSGYSFDEVFFSEDGFPPLQSAVDAEMNRIIWGTKISYPESAVCVYAIGSRSALVGGGAHNILKSTSAGANGAVTCVKYIQDTPLNIRQPVVGWKDDSGQGLDKSSTTYGVSVFRSEVWRIGQPFQVKNMRLLLGQAVAANMAATVKVFVDNGTNSYTVATINNTTYPNGERNIKIYPVNFPQGMSDFFIEIRTTGTSLMTFKLPITITVETLQD